MMAENLPDYRGPLTPAPWSGIRELTGEAKRSLREAALPGCPVCRKRGFLEDRDGTFQICHCVNRRKEAAG